MAAGFLQIRQYKHILYIASETWRGAPAVGNIFGFHEDDGDYFTHRMPARTTFAQTPKRAGSNVSSLVAVPNMFLQSVLQSITRHIRLDAVTFGHAQICVIRANL